LINVFYKALLIIDMPQLANHNMLLELFICR